MRVERLLFWIWLFSGSSGYAANFTLMIPDSGKETRVALKYVLRCRADRGFGALRGQAELPENITRFDLTVGNSKINFLLPPTRASEVLLRIPDSDDCKLSDIHFAVESASFGSDERSLVLRFAPYFIVRKNQYENRDTDVPVAMTYNIFRPAESRRIIQYSLYYTDEDSKRTQAGENSQMARYGRRLDIQWAYRVEIDPEGNKISERFQGGFYRTGIGHVNHRFKGKYLESTEHPILYDISNNNSYSDRPTYGLRKPVGYLFADAIDVPEPTSRERVLFENPWLLEASDLELSRQGKLSAASDEYLYVRVNGKISGVKLVGEIEDEAGDRFKSGGGSGYLDRLGEDTWERESYTAIPMGRGKVLDFLSDPEKTWRFSFVARPKKAKRANISKLEFFLVVRDGVGFRTIDLSDRFRCFITPNGLPSCISGPTHPSTDAMNSYEQIHLLPKSDSGSPR